MLRIKLIKSPIGHTPANRATVRALGLRKVHQVVERPDSPAIRGMIHRIQHLLVVETLNGKSQERASSGDDKSQKKPVEAATKESKPKSAKPKSDVPKTKAVKSKESQS